MRIIASTRNFAARRHKPKSPQTMFRTITPAPTTFNSFDEYLKSTPSSPFVPSAPPVINLALRMLLVDNNDNNDNNDIVHLDIGAGDFRVCISAISQFKVSRSIGIEIDESLCSAVEKNERELIESGKLKIYTSDFRDTLVDLLEIENITHLSTYFVDEGLLHLKDTLNAIQRPTNLRLVTLGFPMLDCANLIKLGESSLMGVDVFSYRYTIH